MLKQIINRNTDPAPAEPQAASAPSYGYSPAPYPNAPQSAATSSPSAVSSRSPMSKNYLANDVEIKGSLKFSNDLIIEGKIEGEIISDGTLTVGENANIIGEIRTRSVTVFGKVHGNVTVTERCELKTNSMLEGDITAGTLSIEEGASFNGKSAVGRKSTGQGKDSKATH